MIRPRDRYGLRLSTNPDAAEAYRLGVDRVLLLTEGAVAQFEVAVALDPAFALDRARVTALRAEAVSAA